MAKTLYLIDGYAQIFRCYYAPFRDLTSPTGEPTRATYVFTNMLLQLVREKRPDYLAMAMDSGTETGFRLQIDPEYKANREAPPEDLAPQIERIQQIVADQKIPILVKDGFEADDVIATLCERLAGDDLDIVIVSKDKDLEQLLTDRVRLYDPNKDEFIGPAELEAKKGYPPGKAIDIQTLTGDSTDNIPGVKGVGPKKAVDLIKRFGSADEVVRHADELTPAMSRNVKAFADRIEQTRQLVTLRTDVPLEFDLEATRWTEVDWAALKPIATELGFQRIVSQAEENTSGTNNPGTAEAEPKPIPTDQPKRETAHRTYTLVDTVDKLEPFLAELRKQPRFAFDTETTSLNAAKADLVGLSFSWAADTGYYLPVRGMGTFLPLEPTLEALRPIFADPDVEKLGQNIKYDLVVLAMHGLPVAGVAFDAMVASFVLDSARPSHGMDALARELLDIEPIPISDLIGKGRDQVTFDSVDITRACEYAAEDADITWQLCETMREQLAGTELETLFNETELPLVEVLTAMEVAGVKIDKALLAAMSKELESRLAELTTEIHREAGHPFNIDSTKQLATVLFDELELPVVRKTKTGRSTDAETLNTLAITTDHPVPKLIREYRELTKLKGTYVDTLPQMISPRTGRIHASFHQTAAITGRLSSSDPNLQNIPIRTEMGRRIRGAFVACDKDHVLLTADYSQVELRVLAHFCRDEALTRAFTEDLDIHAFVAAQVFGVPLEEVDKEQRGRAKAVNFGIIYGQTAYGLSRTTGMPVGEAQRFIDMYFMRYPGIRMFIDETIARAKKQGYVATILGRRRAISQINSRNSNARAQAERLAVNTVIQGSAADLIKRAMINIHRQVDGDDRPCKLLIQVHDELVFEVRRDRVEQEADFIRTQMCSALPLDVPLKVDLAWGNTWLEGK